MQLADSISDMLRAIGEAEPRIDAVARTGEMEWSVVFDDEVELGLTAVPGRGVLTFVSALGQVPEARSHEVCIVLLNLAMLWPQTGGMRAGLSGGEAFLIADLAIEGLSEAALGAAVLDFSERAALWSRFVATGEMLPGQGPEGSETMIRI